MIYAVLEDDCWGDPSVRTCARMYSIYWFLPPQAVHCTRYLPAAQFVLCEQDKACMLAETAVCSLEVRDKAQEPVHAQVTLSETRTPL